MNIDQELKEQQRTARAAGVSARPSVAESAALLDRRISAQRHDNGTLDKEAKSKANSRASSPGVKLEPPLRAKKDSSTVEAKKVKAAQRAVPSIADVFSEKNIKTGLPPAEEFRKDIRVDIAELESQATGKPLRSSDSVAESTSEMTRAERDAAFKNEARNPIKAATASSTAHADLSDLVGDVASKSTSPASGQGVVVKARSRPTIIESNLRDDPALKKVQKNSSSAQSNKNQTLPGSNPSAVGGTQVLRDLDERIAYKTRIIIDNKEPEQAPLEPNTAANGEKKASDATVGSVEKRSLIDESISKMSIDTFGGALEKFQAEHGGALSVLENKLEGIMGKSGGPAPEGFPYDDLEFGGDDPADKLAVAVAVKEEEDDKFIPAAVEYDPDAKPPIFRNRRFRLYSLLACTLIAVMIAGVVGLLTQKKKEPIANFNAPTVAPARPGSSGIVEQLQLIVGSEVLNDSQGPYYQAKEWIINEDPLKLSPSDANLVQRFLLAVIYFQLHERGNWFSCNAPTKENPNDSCLFQKLVNIYPREYRSIAWYRWLSGIHECSWAGLLCDEFHQLRSIDLMGQEIVGKLPTEFAYFPFLQSISLAWNKMSGSIPTEFGNMKQLLGLEVHYNMLTGTIPPEFTQAENLQLFNIASNEISGTLPDSFFDMTNMKGLFLFENLLNGTFPSELGRLSLLTYARFQRNFFTGTIPTELGLLNPRELWAHQMALEGSIPSEIGNMNNMMDLRLHETSINSTIPEELWQLTQLWRLDLFNTQLSGTLSPSVAKLTDLVYLLLRNADLTGTIPVSIANLTELVEVWFDGNEFVGAVPEGMCEHPALDDLTADCLASSGTSEPRVNCSCCQYCCDHSTGLCDKEV